jgi:hypothetical protein
MEQRFSTAQAVVSAVTMSITAIVARLARRHVRRATVLRRCVALRRSRARDQKSGQQNRGKRRTATIAEHHIHRTPLRSLTAASIRAIGFAYSKNRLVLWSRQQQFAGGCNYAVCVM